MGRPSIESSFAVATAGLFDFGPGRFNSLPFVVFRVFIGACDEGSRWISSGETDGLGVTAVEVSASIGGFGGRMRRSMIASRRH